VTSISTALYRIIQESLTNIYKHSAATQVKFMEMSNREKTAPSEFLAISRLPRQEYSHKTRHYE
jgi:hypothetical protein